MRSKLLLALSLALVSTPALADISETEADALPDLTHEVENENDPEPLAVPGAGDESDSPPPPPDEPEPAPASPPVAEPTPEAVSAAASGARPESAPRAPSTWNAFGGLRMAFIASDGFDPFASNDALPQLSLGLGATVYRGEELSLATVGSFDIGGRSASARGEETSLAVASLAVGPEVRYHLGEAAWLHLRPSFQVIRSLASIEEASSQATLHARNWHIGFDAMVGAAMSLGRPGPSTELWVLAEGGYTWSSAAELDLRPDAGEEGSPVHAAGLALGKLAYRGPAFRIAASIHF